MISMLSKISGQMKALITDKPSPITVKLAQTKEKKGDADSVF